MLDGVSQAKERASHSLTALFGDWFVCEGLWIWVSCVLVLRVRSSNSLRCGNLGGHNSNGYLLALYIYERRSLFDLWKCKKQRTTRTVPIVDQSLVDRVDCSREWRVRSLVGGPCGLTPLLASPRSGRGCGLLP